MALAGMEILSTLLLLLGLVNYFSLQIRYSLPQKIFLGFIGLNIIAWVVSVTLNQANTVILPKDLEPIRRLLFVLFPVLIWSLSKERFPALSTFCALCIGFVLSLCAGLVLRDWSGDLRYSGSFSWAITYGVVSSTLLYVMIWLWAETGFKYRAFAGSMIGIIFVSVIFSKTRSAWGGLLLGGITFSLASMSSFKKQVIA